MRALHLMLDDALDGQAGFQLSGVDVDLVKMDARDLGAELRLWTRPRAFSALRTRLRRAMTGQGPWLTFTGSGDFHHVSLLLIARAAAATGEALTVLHFDNHPDWVRFGRGIHCGSWTGRAVRLSLVHRLITVGVCSGDVERPGQTNLEPIRSGQVEIYPYRRANGATSLDLCGRSWPTIASIGEAQFLRHLLQRIATRDVYVTIDKDVLRSADAATNWDQGELSLTGMATLIRGVAARHRLVGADVLGDWSAPRYAGVVDGLLKRAEAFIDQPRRPPNGALQINQPVNEYLLRLFADLLS